MANRKKELSEFGVYLSGLIDEAGMFKTDFYGSIGITRPYFYEILTGNPPPQETLEKMISSLEEKLGKDDKRRTKFFDLAAKCRDEIPADINDLIKAHPDKWSDIRDTLLKLLKNHDEEN